MDITFLPEVLLCESSACSFVGTQETAELSYTSSRLNGECVELLQDSLKDLVRGQTLRVADGIAATEAIIESRR